MQQSLGLRPLGHFQHRQDAVEYNFKTAKGITFFGLDYTKTATVMGNNAAYQLSTLQSAHS